MSKAAENIPVIKTRKKVLHYEDYAKLTPTDSGNDELHQGKIGEGELLPVGVFKDEDEVESQAMAGFKIAVQDILGS